MNTRMVASQFDSGKQFAKKEKIFNSAVQNISMHWHNCFEFDIIQSGSGIMICNGKEYSVERGMICFLSPTDFHEYKNCEQMKLIHLQFRETDLNPELFNQFLLLHTNVIYADDAKLLAMEQLWHLLGGISENFQARLYNKNLLECLILSFLDGVQKENPPCCKVGSIQRAIVYLHAHFKENPSMNDLARMLSYDPNYFCRLFKKSVGVSYKTYLRALKLDYSMKLIQFTDLPIIEIATACGYETQSHFNREFKARYQASPLSFRK